MHDTTMRAWFGGLALAVLGAAAPAAAATFDDPNWPCIQRMVPALSMGQMWSGPPAEGDWRDDPDVRSLAAALAARRNAVDEVEPMVAAFADDMPEAERAPRLALLFSGVIDLVDAERGQLIDGIGRYANNQTALSTRIEAMQAELLTLAAAETKDLDRIEELEDTLDWETRIFRDRAQALTYVCETPVLMEQRAFAIARMLSTHF